MFLTNLSYNKDLSSYDIMSEGYNIVLESERIWHKINMSMVRLEHTAIVNNDYSLLSEGENSWWDKIKNFFKRIWDAIAGFFKKVWNAITSIARKIKEFFTGKKDNDDKKIEITIENDKNLKEINKLSKELENQMAKDHQRIKERVKEITKNLQEAGNNLSNIKEKIKKVVTIKEAKEIANKNADNLADTTKNFQKAQNNLEKQVKKTINTNNPTQEDQENVQASQQIQTELHQVSTQVIGQMTQNVVKLSKELAEMIRTDGDGGAYKEYSDPNFNHPKHFTELDGMVPPIIKEQIKDYIKHTGKVHRGDITVKEAVFEELNRKCDNYELTFDKMNHIYAKARHEYYDQDLYYYLVRTQNK